MENNRNITLSLALTPAAPYLAAVDERRHRQCITTGWRAIWRDRFRQISADFSGEIGRPCSGHWTFATANGHPGGRMGNPLCPGWSRRSNGLLDYRPVTYALWHGIALPDATPASLPSQLGMRLSPLIRSRLRESACMNLSTLLPGPQVLTSHTTLAVAGSFSCPSQLELSPEAPACAACCVPRCQLVKLFVYSCLGIALSRCFACGRCSGALVFSHAPWMWPTLS